MDALVMCGGRGTRLDVPVEKPLLEVCGEPMIEGVLAGLMDSSIDRIHAAVSPHTPDTAAYLRDGAAAVTVLETPGEGYVADLQVALETVAPPVVSVVADLPLLTPGHVERAVRVAKAQSMPGGSSGVDVVSVTVCVPTALKRRLGASVDTTIEHGGRELAPTGLNVVGDADGEILEILDDPRLAANVNRSVDVPVAEALCG